MSCAVVIPTCDRPAMLARCLSALPIDTETIVADDSRDDRSRDMVQREYPHVRWVRGPRRGPAANRNCGVRATQADWVAFIDDDCIPQPGWLQALMRNASAADVLEGQTEAPGATGSPFEECIENLNGGVLWSCNLAIRRSVFDRLGGFDEDFTEAAGEDMEFAWRVRESALRVQFVPGAVVYHPPRWIGWRGLIRRTRMTRWMSLYRLKTNQGRSAVGSAYREVVDLVRSSWHLVRRPHGKYWRRHTFMVLWRWTTLPWLIPSTIAWDREFRRLIGRRNLDKLRLVPHAP